jgi:hypothetical protein
MCSASRLFCMACDYGALSGANNLRVIGNTHQNEHSIGLDPVGEFNSGSIIGLQSPMSTVCFNLLLVFTT